MPQNKKRNPLKGFLCHYNIVNDLNIGFVCSRLPAALYYLGLCLFLMAHIVPVLGRAASLPKWRLHPPIPQ